MYFLTTLIIKWISDNYLPTYHSAWSAKCINKYLVILYRWINLLENSVEMIGFECRPFVIFLPDNQSSKFVHPSSWLPLTCQKYFLAQDENPKDLSFGKCPQNIQFLSCFHIPRGENATPVNTYICRGKNMELKNWNSDVVF